MRERPRKGDRYVVNTAFEAHVLTQWKAPFTDGYPRQLPPGLEFIVDIEPPEAASAVIALPDPYTRWESELISESDRGSAKYNGYYLVVPFDDVSKYCARVDVPSSEA